MYWCCLWSPRSECPTGLFKDNNRFLEQAIVKLHSCCLRCRLAFGKLLQGLEAGLMTAREQVAGLASGGRERLLPAEAVQLLSSLDGMYYMLLEHHLSTGGGSPAVPPPHIYFPAVTAAHPGQWSPTHRPVPHLEDLRLLLSSLPQQHAWACAALCQCPDCRVSHVDHFPSWVNAICRYRRREGSHLSKVVGGPRATESEPTREKLLCAQAMQRR